MSNAKKGRRHYRTVCPNCEQSFAYLGSLAMHVRNVHGMGAEAFKLYMDRGPRIISPAGAEEIEELRSRAAGSYRLSDLWAAYRRGAQEARDVTGAELPYDAQIERACDAYCKLVVGGSLPSSETPE